MDFIRFRIKTLFSVNVLDLYKWIVLKQKPLEEEKFLKRVNKGIYYTFFPTILCKKKINIYIVPFILKETSIRFLILLNSNY